MPLKRLCEKCHTKHAQHVTRPYFHGCARKLGLAAPYRYRYTARDKPPLGPRPSHRVQAMDQFRTPPIQPPAIVDAPVREITAHGVDYIVCFSGRDSLRGSDAPRGFGSSLADTSRVVR